MLDWIREHAGPNTTILTICAGTEILADTGLLDGRTATTNVGWFDKLAARVPTATWVRDVRYYDDGSIITSTNLASGIDTTLHTVERLVGTDVAHDVAHHPGAARSCPSGSGRAHDAPSIDGQDSQGHVRSVSRISLRRAGRGPRHPRPLA